MRVLGDRYELIEPLGRGGMGQVYRARDRALGRLVAVKVLPAELNEHPKFRARFRREAHAAASLSHPCIAIVYDRGEDDDVPYLVMELITGGTLAELLHEEEFLPPDRALRITADVLEALEHSHHKGVVHRDLKPSNIMIDRSGRQPRVKVMDFGIAKLLSDTMTQLTPSGSMVGTLHYMSPEQIRGLPVDARSDLYSLGCVLFELLTGSPPFTADLKAAVLNQHLNKEPQPPSAARPGLPPACDPPVLRALAKDPADRYPDATAMYTALQALLDEGVRDTAARTGRPSRRHTVPDPPTPVLPDQPSAHPADSVTPPDSTPPHTPVTPAAPAGPAAVPAAPAGQGGTAVVPREPEGVDAASAPGGPPGPDGGPAARQRELARAVAHAHIRAVTRVTCYALALVALLPVAGLSLSWSGPFDPRWLTLIVGLLLATAWAGLTIPRDPGALGRTAVHLLAAATAATPVAMVFAPTWWNLPLVVALGAGGLVLWALELKRPDTTPARGEAGIRLAGVAATSALAWLATLVGVVGLPDLSRDAPRVSTTGEPFAELSDPTRTIRVSVPKTWRRSPQTTWNPAASGITDRAGRPALWASTDPARFRRPEHDNPGIFIGLTRSTVVPRHSAADHTGSCTRGTERRERLHSLNVVIVPWTSCTRGTKTITEIGLTDPGGRYAAWIRLKQTAGRPDLTDRILAGVRLTPPPPD
ncbi:protein kinase domain-containing protein [Actinomadura scrupuli]|uniref:protein kinase domain-containing protein n=1 Tax=Actinomadura scrupuli TaxID=559629 RepID=UPI003D977DDE